MPLLYATRTSRLAHSIGVGGRRVSRTNGVLAVDHSHESLMSIDGDMAAWQTRHSSGARPRLHRPKATQGAPRTSHQRPTTQPPTSMTFGAVHPTSADLVVRHFVPCSLTRETRFRLCPHSGKKPWISWNRPPTAEDEVGDPNALFIALYAWPLTTTERICHEMKRGRPKDARRARNLWG